MRRFYRRVIVPLCLSTVFCTMPVHASEAAENAETAAVEAAAEEGENNAEDSIAQFVSTEDNAGDITDSIAVEEGIEQNDGEAADDTANENGEGATVTGESSESEENAAAGEKTEPEENTAAGEKTEPEENAASEENEPAEEAEATDAGAADEAVVTDADAADEAAAITGEGTGAEEAAKAETAALGATEAVAEAADDAKLNETAETVPEVSTVAEPALKSTAGAVGKITQMKLEVIDYLGEDFGDGQMLSSGNSRLLIDTYSWFTWNALNNWLTERKYNDFDIYVSHYHHDHIGNVVNILNDGKYNVKKLYLPDYGYLDSSNSYMQYYKDCCDNILRTAKEKKVQVVTLAKDSVFNVGDVSAKVLWGANYKNSVHDGVYMNNNSLVTKFTCGNVRYLNAGDIAADAEREVLDAGIDISADIFKLNHHGAIYSNSKAFLEKVGAEFIYHNFSQDTDTTYCSTGSAIEDSMKNAQKIGNVASVRYNGNITYGVYNDVISQTLERNCTTQNVYLYDPNDPNKLRGIVTQNFNKVTTKHLDEGSRAYGIYDFSTTKRENTYADDGWLIGNGDTQYYYRNNTPVKGWLFDGGSTYYMNPNTAKKETGWKQIAGNTYFFNESGKMTTGFAKIGTAVHHFNDKGHQTKAGWAWIGGKWYYFDANNKLMYGVQSIGGKKYYLDRVNGAMGTGKITQWGSTYLADASGALYPAGWNWYNGNWYYLDNNGKAATGWKWDGAWYYMNGTGVMLTGWQNINGKRYYMNGSGAMQTGWQYLGGNWYYLDRSGAMQTGWQYLGGVWYYLDGSGAMKTGWQKIGGVWYLMNGSGAMQTGWKYINGIWYYLNGSGAMATGWQRLGGEWYYFDRSGAMKTGWQSIDGVRYYFNRSGAWIG